ncbi:hypothetical protein [Actinomadura chibensis]|uniref:hypothetical protein n=1 Tax=Actinomadura chibensis TaxID=392828 RepID=UPI000833BDEE|nr:hypothetical protein [Actinomadura chibensis]
MTGSAVRRGHERVRRLVASAALSTDVPWLLLVTAPVRDAHGSFDDAGSARLRDWARDQVASWPGPVPIADEPPLVQADRVVFSSASASASASAPSSDAPGARYRCEFHADGSALIALAAGGFRENPVDGVPVWAIGEGAIAWITIAALRLAAAYADRAGVLGGAVVETAVTPYGDDGASPIEVWNHDRHTYGPAGCRLVAVEPSRRVADLSRCLSAGLAGVARPSVVDVLSRFGLSGERHIDQSGVIRRGNFTGFDDHILAWTEAIGIPSRP